MREFLNDTRYIWLGLTVAAVFLLVGGCHSGNGGCSMNDSLTAESAAVPKAPVGNKDYEEQLVNQYHLGGADVIKDHVHDCEYVVINNSVFVWRGTNLLAYTGHECAPAK